MKKIYFLIAGWTALFLASGINLNAQTYCVSGSTSPIDSEIHNVTLVGDNNTINHTTIGQPNLYNYFDTLSADLSGNNMYTISVLLGTTGTTQYGKSGAVYIDWNNDGDFDDPNEFLGYIGPFPFGEAPVPVSIQFSIPSNAVTGTTRLRVVCVETTNLASLGPCNTVTYGETEDYNIVITSLPTCLLPSLTGITDITNVSATVGYTAGPNTIYTSIQYGPPGFTPGTGTNEISVSSPYTITGLTQNTSYEVYLRTHCPNNETSIWVGPYSFTTMADNVISVVYDDGDIPTIFEASPGSTSVISPCAGSLMVNVPAGMWITSVDVTYQMSAQNGAWMIEQRSRLWSPTGNVGEEQYFSGTGSTAGVFTYTRTNLTQFFGLYGEVEFLLDAKRTWTFSQPACETYHNYVVNNTWVLNIALDTIPSCIAPIGIQASLSGPNSVAISYIAIADTVNILYGPTGFNPNTSGTLITNVTDNPFILTGLGYDSTYDFYIQSNCGPDDGLSDFAGPISFSTECAPILVTPTLFSCENFENGGLIPTCWRQGFNNGGTKNWQFSNTPSGNLGQNGQFSGSTLSGGYFAWVNDAAPHVQGTTLLSPWYDVSALTFPQLTFHLIRHAQGGQPVDFRIELNNGTGWEEIFFSNSNVFPWEQFILNLGSYTDGADMIRLRFIVDENNGTNITDNIAIDDVCVRQAPVNDLGVTSIISPAGASCDVGANDTLRVTVYNFGSAPQTIFQMRYSVNGGPAVLEFYNSTINPGTEIEYVFETPLNLPGPGEYVVKAWSGLLSGQPDEFPVNDTASTTITLIPNIDQLPYLEGFESGSGGWTSGGTGTLWEIGQPSTGFINSAYSGNNAAVTNLTGQYVNNTQSWFTGPCFDFSDLDTDPVIEFAMIYNTENCCDGFWIERSIDGGATWQKIPAHPSGQNWYNNLTAQRWNGTSNGWLIAKSVIQDVAGESDVRIRFFFTSDISIVSDGVGIDDIFIYEPVTTDITPSNIAVVPPAGCYDEETINVTLFNNGSDELNLAATPVQVNLNVTGPVNQNLVTFYNEGILAPFASVTVPFTVDMSIPGTYTFTAITTLAGDQLTVNDTLVTNISTPVPQDVPFLEDFENVPSLAALTAMGWTSVGGGAANVYAAGAHTLPSRAISYNLYSTGTVAQCTLTTPLIGPLPDSAIFSFDYRYVDWSAGTVATVLGNDSLRVQVSVDCGQTWTTLHTINSSNHTPTTEMTNVVLNMLEYEDEIVQMRFIGHRTQGDYWLDLDNINLERPWNFDIMPHEIVSPKLSGECGHDEMDIYVSVMNLGIQPTLIIQVNGMVEKDGETWPLQGFSVNPLEMGESDTVWVGSFNSSAGGEYHVTLYTVWGSDENPSNDTLHRVISTFSIMAPEIEMASTSVCLDQSAILVAVPEGPNTNFSWYAAATDIVPMFSGDTFYTPPLDGPVTYFLGVSSGAEYNVGKMSLETNASGTGGGLGSYMVFNAHTDFILQSVDIYPYGTGPGTITIELRDLSNTVLASQIVSVTGSLSAASPAQTVSLGFEVTGGATYRLGVGSWTGGVTNMFRDNTNLSFPYTVPDVIDITESNLGTGFYYFYYNWNILTVSPCERPMASITLEPAVAPAAAFTFESQNLAVQFANNSQNAITYHWDFGDGFVSTETEPAHVFDAPGTYTVCLTASGNCGDHEMCADVTVICPSPQASFGFELNGGMVSFMNNSNLADSYLWDFGDGNTSTLENPVHTYDLSGEYEVCLTAMSDCGEVTVCETLLITSIHPSIKPGSLVLHPNPNTGIFIVKLALYNKAELDLRVVDVSGKLLYKTQLNTAGEVNVPLTLDDLPSGLYFVQVYINSEQAAILRFVRE